MDSHNRILVVDSRKDIHTLLKDVLQGFELRCVEDLGQALAVAQKERFDLSLVAITLPNTSGYEIVQQLKGEGFISPIIYLADDDCEIKKDIEYCKIKSISQPYGKGIIVNHIRNTIEQFVKEQENRDELNDVTNAVLTLQNNNAKLYDISRFMQNSFFCDDIESLCEQLFVVTRAYGTSCTLFIHTDQHNFFVSDGEEKQVNHNILTMLKDEGHIYQFGNDRAVLNWSGASLLVNRVGDDLDNLAMLMDGFEIGLNAIETVEEFHQVLNRYREQNHELRVNAANIVEDVAGKINEQLISFGAETTLTEEQEEALMAIGEESRKQIDLLFSHNLKFDEELTHVMTKMRTQAERADSEKVSDNTIEFF